MVIGSAIRLIHQDGIIESIAQSAVSAQKQENSAIPLLENQLKEIEKGIGNMLNALQMGIATESTKARLESLEAEKKDLELSIAKEKMERPEIPKEFFEFWLNKIKSGDPADPLYHQMIVDVFVNAVYVFDDKLVLGLNFMDGTTAIALKDMGSAMSSNLAGCSPPSEITHS